MSTRYVYNLTLAIVAAFLIVATQAFAAEQVAWLTFAISVAVTIAAVAAVPLRFGRVQRALCATTAAVAAWTVVASLVFAPATVVWLGFASAVALVALAVSGLTTHELSTERVVHSLEVQKRRGREPVAA